MFHKQRRTSQQTLRPFRSFRKDGPGSLDVSFPDRRGAGTVRASAVVNARPTRARCRRGPLGSAVPPAAVPLLSRCVRAQCPAPASSAAELRTAPGGRSRSEPPPFQKPTGAGHTPGGERAGRALCPPRGWVGCLSNARSEKISSDFSLPRAMGAFVHGASCALAGRSHPRQWLQGWTTELLTPCAAGT